MIEQLSHPFMLIVITLMVVIAVIALVAYLFTEEVPAPMPQATKNHTQEEFEAYIKTLGRTDLRVLRDQYKNRLKSFMVTPQRSAMMIELDSIDHLLGS